MYSRSFTAASLLAVRIRLTLSWALSYHHWLCWLLCLTTAWWTCSSIGVCFGLLVLDMLSYVYKGVLDIFTGLCWGFEEFHAVLIGQCLTLFSWDNFLLQPICLVPDQYFFYVLWCMKLYLTDPVLNVLETFLNGAIIGQNNAHGAFIVSLSDRAEAFLACGVPNLQFNVLSIDLDRFNFEVNSYKEKIRFTNYTLKVDFQRCICHTLERILALSHVPVLYWYWNLPMVEICDEVKFSSANLSKKHVLPTPESPIRINLIK